MTRKSRGDESHLMQSIAQIVKEINTSKKDYKINLGIVNTQRKIKEAAAGSFHDGDITFFTVEDLERWRTQLQNPETFLDSELEAPEREPVNVEEEKQLLRDEAVEFPRHDGDTTNEQMKSIFSESAVSEYRNMSDAERKHWETLVGTFHGTDMHDQISAVRSKIDQFIFCPQDMFLFSALFLRRIAGCQNLVINIRNELHKNSSVRPKCDLKTRAEPVLGSEPHMLLGLWLRPATNRTPEPELKPESKF